MRRGFPLKFSVILGCAFGACLAASCSGDGATSVCPPLPQYQTYPLGDASIMDASVAGASAAEQIARAVDAGCYTAPTLFPSDGGMGGAGPDADGNGGAGGSSAGAAGTH